MDHDLGVIGVGKWHVYSNSQRLSGVGNFFCLFLHGRRPGVGNWCCCFLCCVSQTNKESLVSSNRRIVFVHIISDIVLFSCYVTRIL